MARVVVALAMAAVAVAPVHALAPEASPTPAAPKGPSLTLDGSAALAVATPAAVPAATGSGAGLDAVAILARANEAYSAGDWSAAVAGYRALIDAGHGHPLLHYDLGNAYLRQGDLGRAIASYRRARAGAPRNQDVVANLEYARKSARDEVAPPEPAAVWRTVFAWYYALAPSELWAAAAIFNVALWSLLAIRLWRRHEALIWAAAAAGLLLLLCAGALVFRELGATRVAVIVPHEVEVRTGIRDDTAVRFKLHAGSEVVVRDQRDGWLRIALPSGEQGWVEAADVELVEM